MTGLCEAGSGCTLRANKWGRFTLPKKTWASLKAASFIAISLVGLSLAYPANADGGASADVEAGAALYKKECRACHGPTAKGMSAYPKLRGQTAEYLAEMLERYRAGEKIGPNTMLMAPRAKKLSDEDIVNISEFIASIE